MQTEQEKACDCAHLIRLTVDPDSSVDLGLLTRAVCALGGVATEEGYAFEDASQRALALDVLSERFGSRYVDAVD